MLQTDIKMPWGKTKSVNLQQEKSKSTSGQEIQGTYKKKETLNCNNCPHRTKQISAYQESKLGKLARIL